MNIDLINKLLTIAFPASIVTAILASIFNKITNDKNQSLKYVTDERAKWRNFVKDSASKIYSREYENESKKVVITKLILSLNPLSKQGEIDHTIILLIHKIEKGTSNEHTLEQLRFCISMLLKHDWERSKNETMWVLKRIVNYRRERNVIKEYKKWYANEVDQRKFS
ncbi:hypothetical protein [Paenibacillus sp. NAIST15-1]|uniref:hypothetical protein n=1 Tax=Paenibacillus sp. NAIST15-1 TaxID=1605994 RepID=UPI00086A11FE|nr:hypothetical protein [Paenibacillus sp. NAIST15-1]GAV11420.1 hypothetical protein PBN151_1349 [Paenibacillus sp. NAIST15-1]